MASPKNGLNPDHTYAAMSKKKERVGPQAHSHRHRQIQINTMGHVSNKSAA
jgi:hypothetical protein